MDDTQANSATAPFTKVLVVDDSSVMRSLLTSQLNLWGWDVVEAVDGLQAWDLFKEQDFSLVLTDWIMPNMDGIELIRCIREHAVGHYVYIILLTAKTEKEDLILAMDAGADDFLIKPCDSQELRVRLREGVRILKLEQKLAEQNLAIRQAQATLVQNEKLVSLGQLAAGMAHEINNPISYISNNLSVLRRDVTAVLEILAAYQAVQGDLRTVNPQALARIEQLEQDLDMQWVAENTLPLLQSSSHGLQRIRDIVANLREFARLDEAELDKVAVADSLRNTLAILKHLLDERRISVEISNPTNPQIVCRPVLLNQVWHNILMNAIQASHAGGNIRIDIDEQDEMVTVSISDQGVGIEDAVLAKIFEPFFTTRAVGKGTGLGLSMCYGVIRQHGGEILASSQVGQGTTIQVRLPKQPLE